MNVETLRELANQWRQEAAVLRRRSASLQAEILESNADELDTALRDWMLEPLTLEAAEQESGYSRSTLERKLASGEIENAGRRGRPRVRRRDLPFKAGSGEPATADGEPDISAIALAAQ